MEINPRAPMVARKEIFVNASPEAVWKIQSNINGWRDWQTDITKSQLDGELKPNAIFKWTSGGFAVTSTIQEVVPQQRLAWSGKALGSFAKHIWMFKPQDGGTLVTTEESMEGWLISILKPFAPGFLDKSLEVWIQNLKKRAEGKSSE
jgi:uncharacterized protein YndB with AHSA1/START domain